MSRHVSVLAESTEAAGPYHTKRTCFNRARAALLAMTPILSGRLVLLIDNGSYFANFSECALISKESACYSDAVPPEPASGWELLLPRIMAMTMMAVCRAPCEVMVTIVMAMVHYSEAGPP